MVLSTTYVLQLTSHRDTRGVAPGQLNMSLSGPVLWKPSLASLFSSAWHVVAMGVVDMRQRRVALYAVLALPLLFYFYYFAHRFSPSGSFRRVSWIHHDGPKPKPSPRPPPSLSSPSPVAAAAGPGSLDLFWPALLNVLMRTEPDLTAGAAPIRVEKPVALADFDPNGDAGEQRADRIALSEQDVGSLSRSQADFVVAAEDLASRLPFDKKSRGIVMTAGGKYVGIAVTSQSSRTANALRLGRPDRATRFFSSDRAITHFFAS